MPKAIEPSTATVESLAINEVQFRHPAPWASYRKVRKYYEITATMSDGTTRLAARIGSKARAKRFLVQWESVPYVLCEPAYESQPEIAWGEFITITLDDAL